ncbi:MAG TPA: C-terminal binding protein [Candidatus Aminicenantes bacterium]|nr:C-terminal binding protein [Candidatus Aminicenantes bacterium]HRY65830.1 C-terminal binding protein [Candidatus Aminicenantes bacterium]HRZ72844.1 C-terminal binding protein [Candidatus Aminicenantes bacterium]
MSESGPIVFKVTDYIERDLAWEEKECRKLGVRFSYYQLKDAPAAEIVRQVGDADIVLVNMAGITADVVAGLTRTRLILRHGIGYDNVDVPACSRNGIVFANEATASSEDVAEHAVMLMFEAYKKKRLQDVILRDWIRTGLWSSKRIHPIYRLLGKTLGIVGCGNIGARVLGKVRGLGMTVLVCDPYLPPERLAELGVANTPLDEVLRRSDIVTIHVPVTAETRGLFDFAKFSLMKPSAVVVNTARGPIIRTADLIRALKEGVIAGAALDVFEEEPPKPKLALFKMKNVILSPHVAWYSEEGGIDIRRMIMADVRAFVEGRLPRFVINRDVLGAPGLRYPLEGGGPGRG